MRVKVAWSVELADTSWRKNEVEIDEVDLKRLLLEAEIDPELPMTTIQVFKLMECEAQRLLMAMMISRYAIALKTSDNIAQLQSYQSQRDALLAGLKGV